MKRFFLSVLTLMIGLVIMFVSLWRPSRPFVSLAFEQQSEMESTKAGVESSEMMESAEVVEDYKLAYPGMLPDHPLYFLKMMRDRVQLWLTRGDVKKAELFLLNADKRISASLVLAEKGKPGLAVSTALKAEQYLERAVNAVMVEQIDEVDRERLVEKLLLSAKKHSDVLAGVSARVPDELVSSMTEAQDLVSNITERLIGEVGEPEEEVEMEVREENSMQEEGEMIEIEEEISELGDK